MQLYLYHIKKTTIYCCFSKGKDVSYDEAALQITTHHTDSSSDTHSMDQTWWSPMWNLVMRVCTPARSSPSWTWLKPEANSLYVVRSRTLRTVFYHYASIFNCFFFYSCSYLLFFFFLFCCSDRPDPPVSLQISDAKRRNVTLNWTPGDDHNSAVLGWVTAHTHTRSFQHRPEKVCKHLPTFSSLSTLNAETAFM